MLLIQLLKMCYNKFSYLKEITILQGVGVVRALIRFCFLIGAISAWFLYGRNIYHDCCRLENEYFTPEPQGISRKIEAETICESDQFLDLKSLKQVEIMEDLTTETTGIRSSEMPQMEADFVYIGEVYDDDNILSDDEDVSNEASGDDEENYGVSKADDSILDKICVSGNRGRSELQENSQKIEPATKMISEEIFESAPKINSNQSSDSESVEKVEIQEEDVSYIVDVVSDEVADDISQTQPLKPPWNEQRRNELKVFDESTQKNKSVGHIKFGLEHPRNSEPKSLWSIDENAALKVALLANLIWKSDRRFLLLGLADTAVIFHCSRPPDFVATSFDISHTTQVVTYLFWINM